MNTMVIFGFTADASLYRMSSSYKATGIVPIRCRDDVHAPRSRQSPMRGGRSARLVGRASVIDGHTIKIHGKRVRLCGVDAPEKRSRG